MELPGLPEVVQRPLLDLGDNLQGALLYLDNGAAEVVQTTLGLPFLLGLGVSNVCSLEAASSEDALLPALAAGGAPPATLAVFTTQLLTDIHPYIVRAVLAHPYASTVQIYCSVSEHAHACQASTDLGVEAYREYAHQLERQVRQARSAAVRRASAGGTQPVHSRDNQQQQYQQELDGAATGTHSQAQSAGGGGDGPVPLAVRLEFLPLLACCLDANLFVLPACGSAASRAVSGNVAAGFGPADPPSEAAAEGVSGGLSLLAHALVGLAGQMGCRLEPFPIGAVSSLLAAEVSSLPVSLPAEMASRGASASPMALILLDRSLDLATPAMHHDHPWDLLLAAGGPGGAPLRQQQQQQQQPLPGGGGKVVTWRPLDLRAQYCPDAPPADPGAAAATGAAATTNFLQLRCELLEPGDRSSAARLEQLACRKGKDGLAGLRKGLKEALRAEKLTPAVRSKAGAVQPAELKGLAEALVGSAGPALRQRGIAALSAATAEALGGRASERWEAAAGLERSLLPALLEGGEGGEAAQVLLDALDAAAHGHELLSAAHVLSALPVAYSVAPDAAPASQQMAGVAALPWSQPQEQQLREALVTAILACRQPRRELAGLLPEEVLAALEERQAAAAAAEGRPGPGPPSQWLHAQLGGCMGRLFSALRYAAGARMRLKDLRRVTHADVFAENVGSLNPLLRQVVRKLLQRAELQDWQQQPSGGTGLVRGLLSAGLGFMGARNLVGARQAAQPGEFGAVMVFVVGGISPAEVREVRMEYEESVGSAKPRLLLGGTALLSPGDVAMQLVAG